MTQYRVTLEATDGNKYQATVDAPRISTAKTFATAYAATEGHKVKEILLVETRGYGNKWYAEEVKTY